MPGRRWSHSYLDVPFRFLVLDQCANAFHQVGRVLVTILYDANAAGRVVELDIDAKGVQVALD